MRYRPMTQLNLNSLNAGTSCEGSRLATSTALVLVIVARVKSDSAALHFHLW